jgi:hypothetical protein
MDRNPRDLGGRPVAPRPTARPPYRPAYSRPPGRGGPRPAEPEGGWPGILLGLALTAALHLGGSLLLTALLGEFVRRPGDALTAYFGIVQLVYMVPAIVIARKKEFVWVARGLIAGAVITALMNAGCWVIVAMG